MPAPTPVIVTEEQMKQLRRMRDAPTSSKREAFRAGIVLGLSMGKSAKEVARELQTSMPSVSKWRGRWNRQGFAGLGDAPGRGRKVRVCAKASGAALAKAGGRAPSGGAWSVQEMAAETGLSKSTVHRLWRAQGLQPHRTRGFKISTDRAFEEKYWDVVGLYLHPPQNAVVLCCDEKSQCQALERTQTGLPLGQGHIRTRTHDYYRHGTVTLFAALDYLTGKVFAHTAKRHRHQEWLSFLKKIDADVAAEKEIHVICDNYATHKHPKVKVWLARHPRFRLHFTPTSASWLNLVERFFGEITRKVIRPGSFQNVPELVTDIFRFLDHHNLKPTRYHWTEDPKAVLDKINRAWDALLEEAYKPIYGT